MPDFAPFPSIPRLFRDCVVTEKVDGTNAQITFEPASTISGYALHVGSRNRFITPDDDNYGFARWVYERRQTLFDALGYGTHYGEWYGQGIQRGYGMTEKRLALFNSHRWTPEADTLRPLGIDVVPVLYHGPFDTQSINGALGDLRRDGSKIAPGFPNPEGIIIFHQKSGQLFKATLDKNDGHKGGNNT